MGFCMKCGTKATDGVGYCGSCGTPVAASSQTAAAGAPAQAMTSNLAGLVAYVLGPVTGIFMLFVEPYKNDKFVRFHAFQSIFVSAVYLVVLFAWNGITSGLIYVSFGSVWGAVYFVWLMIRLAFLVLWLFLMYKAYNNQQFELPFIGPIARKQAG